MNWDANTEPDLAGYKLHSGTTSGTYSTHIDVGNSVSRTVDAPPPGTTYYFAVTAYDTFGNESGYSNEVPVTTPVVVVETISTPLRPVGPSIGFAGVAYSFSASGALSNTGDAVQYRFSWSDGSNSDWLPAGVTSASKTWSAAGSYTLVQVEARCSLHTSVVSAPSPALTVTIAAAPQETVSAPATPSGPTSGEAGKPYTYTTGGAVSSSGHAVEYRFSWSDGTVSQWLPAVSASATKTWNAPGTYTLVRTEARCALHPAIISAASSPMTVTISSGVAETVSLPFAPAGPAGGDAGTMYVFSTGGSESSTGDPVVYRFHWGDGTMSEWVGPGQPVSAGKSWSAPGTYLVQAEAACATHPTVGSFSQQVEVSIAEGLAPAAAHVLWTRSDTGQAALWEVDLKAMPGTIPIERSVQLYSLSGVGKPWQATSYTHVSETEGYVLWTRSDIGKATLWQIDPSLPTGPDQLKRSVSLYSTTGVGKPWEATSYTHVSATEGYVLWTRSDSGQASLWQVDPSLPTGPEQLKRSVLLYSTSGIGRPWQAMSYTHVSATEGYVLWTRSDSGRGVLWQIDPSLPTGTEQLKRSVSLYSASGVGRPWQATSYTHVSPTEGYVLWTRSDSGRGVLWKIDPSGAGVIPIDVSADLYTPAGVGRPWEATSLAR